MPCARCGGLLVAMDGPLACPPCRGMDVVPESDALDILEALTSGIKRRILAEIGACGRDLALRTAFLARESIARSFLFEGIPLDVKLLSGCSAAIKWLCGEGGARPEPRAGPDRIRRLVGDLGDLLFRQESGLDIKAGACTMVRAARGGGGVADLDGAALDDFPVYPNERYIQTYDPRARLGMITRAEAEGMIGGAKAAGAPDEPGPAIPATLEGTIRYLYNVAYLFAEVFQGNSMRMEHGAPPAGERVPFSPLELRNFVMGFKGAGALGVREFKDVARSAFKKQYNAFAGNFLAGDASPGAFPLFLRVGDTVHLPHWFGAMYCCGLLPIAFRDEFASETARRGRLYEKVTVPSYFENLRYEYTTGCRNKKVEVDGVAVSKTHAYVVEAKFWNPRKFLGDPPRRGAFSYMISDSIDGTHYERKDGSVTKSGVSMEKKIEFVNANRAIFDIPPETPISGTLAINVASHAKEYRGYKILHVEAPDYGLGDGSPAPPDPARAGAPATARHAGGQGRPGCAPRGDRP